MIKYTEGNYLIGRKFEEKSDLSKGNLSSYSVTKYYKMCNGYLAKFVFDKFQLSKLVTLSPSAALQT